MVDPVNRVSSTTGTTNASSDSQPITNRGKNGASTAPSESRDSVALSPKAQLARDVAAAANRSSGVDGARVQAVREALANSRLTVSPIAIARAVAEAVWLARSK